MVEYCQNQYHKGNVDGMLMKNIDPRPPFAVIYILPGYVVGGYKGRFHINASVG